jgi:hypothetical protein
MQNNYQGFNQNSLMEPLIIMESTDLEMTKIYPKKYFPPIIEEEKERSLSEEGKGIRRSKSYERESSGYGFFIFNGGLDEISLKNDWSMRHRIKSNMVYEAHATNI